MTKRFIGEKEFFKNSPVISIPSFCKGKCDIKGKRCCICGKLGTIYNIGDGVHIHGLCPKHYAKTTQEVKDG